MTFQADKGEVPYGERQLSKQKYGSFEDANPNEGEIFYRAVCFGSVLNMVSVQNRAIDLLYISLRQGDVPYGDVALQLLILKASPR